MRLSPINRIVQSQRGTSSVASPISWFGAAEALGRYGSVQKDLCERRTIDKESDERAHQAREGQTVQQDEAKDAPLLAIDAGGGACDDHALRSDHLAHHAAS